MLSFRRLISSATRQDSPWQPRITDLHHRRLLLFFFCLLAFAVRVAGLGEPPLSGDEAFSVLLAERSWHSLLTTLRTTEPNPPLHFVLLKLWMPLAGRGEFAVRFPSAAAGVMAVPLTYALGRWLLGTPVGLMAALLVAVNPYLVWYDHFARAYSLYLALTLGSWVVLMRTAYCVFRESGSQHRPKSHGHRAHWPAYVAVTTLALYAHYFAFLLFLAQALTFLPYAIRNTRYAIRSTLPWLAQATVLLLFAPWLFLAAPMLLRHEKPWLTYTPPLRAVWRTLRAFSLGMPPYGAYAPWLTLLFGIVLVAGLVIVWHRQPGAAWVLTAYTFGPLLAVLAVSLIRPVFLERYLIGTAPAFLVLMAAGLIALGWRDEERRTNGQRWTISPLRSPYLRGFFRRLGVQRSSLLMRRAPFVALLALTLLAAATATPYGVEIADWRGVARTLTQQVAPEDVVVQNYPDPAFTYYYAGPAEALVLPASVPVNRPATDARLRALLAEHRRLWLLPHRDPTWDADGFVERWLELRARRVLEAQVAGHRLLAYEATPPAAPAMDARLNWRLGDLARLAGYTLEPRRVCPGEHLTLTLFWAPLRATEVSYTVFVHLWDGRAIWGQKDGPPQAGRFPTTDWFPGDFIADRREIPVDPATPPGTYQLIAGLYRLEMGARLPVYDPQRRLRGDAVPITAVEVGCQRMVDNGLASP